MNIYQDHASQLDDLQVEQNDGSLEFTWNNSSFNILPGGYKFGRKNDIGGFELDSDLMLTCTTDQFKGALPLSGNKIIYAGLTYNIKRRTTMPGGYQMRLECDLLISGT